MDSFQQVPHSVPDVMAGKRHTTMPSRPPKVTTSTNNWSSIPVVTRGNRSTAVVESIMGSDRMAAPLLPTDTRQCIMDELARVATANHRPWFRWMQGDDSVSTACVICRPNRLAICARCGSGCCSNERRSCAVVAALRGVEVHCVAVLCCVAVTAWRDVARGRRCVIIVKTDTP